MANTQHFLAPHVWLNCAWAHNVLLTVGTNGCWQAIDTQPSAAAMQAATLLPGTVLPSLVNAHSHAFQRAFAGMAETRLNDSDHFWSWRDRMYGVANRVTPAQLQAIAAQLYLELLQGGYTQVCEFHYLHHDIGGKPYADADAMSWALIKAAQQVGIGLTLLPVLYERAGFNGAALRTDQQRFASDAPFVSQLSKRFNEAGIAKVNAGVAIHSLRAASSESIHALQRLMDGSNTPIHIHVSEQMAEVNECKKITGQRPVEWLAQQGLLDARWHLVHATHTTRAEIEATAKHGANVVICPTTEANLGDGFTDVAHWLNAGVGVTIGSDSHVSRTWKEELRWMEYGQRLRLQGRNICAAPASGQPSTAQRLFQAVQAGGAAAAGFQATGFLVGARADCMVLDVACPALLGVPAAHTLDALMFAADAAGIAQVYVAGERLIDGGVHPQQTAIAQTFMQTMRDVWRV
jgi:formimidoylglutamate deiminase